MKNRFMIATLIGSILLFSIFSISNNQAALASAENHMKLTLEERTTKAKNNYSNFEKDPDKKTEVLISFKKTATKEDILDLIPQDAEIVSEFHYFKTSENVVVGAFRDCKGKSLDKIQKQHLKAVSDLVDGKIASLRDNLARLEKREDELEKVSDDVSIMDAQDADAIKKNVPTVETVEVTDVASNIVDEEIATEIASIKTAIRDLTYQKDSIDKGEFFIQGLRIISKNSELAELSKKDKVRIVETLNFDNNDLVSPIVE